MAEARRDAAAEADELAQERHVLEERMEREAMALSHSFYEPEELSRRHTDALRRAGRDVGHNHSIRLFLPTWFQHRFGGHGSLVGVPGSPAGGRERTLPERDPLAAPRTEPDRQASLGACPNGRIPEVRSDQLGREVGLLWP
jgi:hypothetical protein